MRVLNLPALPAAAVSGENWMEVYWERYTASLMSPWPRVSARFDGVSGLAERWRATKQFHCNLPNEGLSSLTRLLLTRQELAKVRRSSAVAKLAVHSVGGNYALERKWLEVAEIFQLIVDIAFEDHAISPWPQYFKGD